MNTTIYLIRHSIRLNNDYIQQYNTIQNKTIRNEKIVLSVEGEKRAEILSNEKELQNLDVVFASNCVRTLQTAKYIIDLQIFNTAINEYMKQKDKNLILLSEYAKKFKIDKILAEYMEVLG